MASTVLILGAAGRFGHTLARAFADAGWTVRAQARKALPPSLGRKGIAFVQCDALDASAMKRAAEGVDVIVHALNPLYTEWDRLALPLADAAIAAARSSGALLMLPGNVYNFGSELPAVLTTTTPECGDIPKARLRIETEARMAATPGLDSIVIRAGDFFGGAQPGSWFDLAMATKLISGRFVYPGDPSVMHAWAYLPDLAQAFVGVAERRAVLHGHRRLHFAGHSVTGNEMREAFEALTGEALRPAGMPWFVMRLAAPFVPMLREVVKMRYLWRRPHRLDDSDLRLLIGTARQTPLKQAVAQAWRDLQPTPSSDSAALSASARA
jgi:nucleoside-diphosphate-sugar epimerase